MRLPELLASASNQQQQQQQQQQQYQQQRSHRHHYHQRRREREVKQQQQQQQQQPQHQRRAQALLQIEGGEEGRNEEKGDEGEDEESERRFVDLWCPRLAGSNIFERVSVFVKSAYLEYFIDIIIIANLALALVAHEERTNHSSSTLSPTPSPSVAPARAGPGEGAFVTAAAAALDDEPTQSGQTILSQRDFSLVAAAIFTVEVVAKLFVHGYRRYVSSYMNLFDATLTFLTVGGAIYEFSSSSSGGSGGNSSSNSQRHAPFLVFELLRILRLFRALMAVPQFRTTGHAFVKILPSASSLFLNLFAVTFVFAAVGLEAYGGLVNTDQAKVEFEVLAPTYYYEKGLFIFNFNDLGGGFIILVELLIDSSLIQPFNEALGALVAGGGGGGRVGTMLYFVSYYCLGQLVLLNIVVCFILDAFLYERQEDKMEEKQEEGREEGKRIGEEDGNDKGGGVARPALSVAVGGVGGAGRGGRNRGGETVAPVLG